MEDTKADKERFRNIMQGLAEDKGIQLSASGLALKFEALKQFSIEDIHKAALAMMMNKRYANMPAVSDFIEHLGGGSAEDRGTLQATIVWNTLRQYGSNRDVVFDDPVTMAVISQGFGGWQKLGTELMEDQMQWFIKDFAKLYTSFFRSGVKKYGVLSGRSNLIGKDPQLIGDPTKAQEVLLLGTQSENKQIDNNGSNFIATLANIKSIDRNELPLVDGMTVTELADKLF